MAFWNTDRLKNECQAHNLISPYRADRVIHSAYELAVGPEAYITSKSGDTTHLGSGAKVTIPPGQFGLLITSEVVYVPNSAIAFISMRGSIKFQGLVNVSGFHVDPGFRGQLKFAVYNAGSRDIVLDQDQQIFMIWYADLDAPCPDPYNNKTLAAGQSVLTSLDVSRLSGDVASPAELKSQLEKMCVAYDMRIHSIETKQAVLQTFLISLLVGAILLFVREFYSSKGAASPQPVKSNSQPPVSAAQVERSHDALPEHSDGSAIDARPNSNDAPSEPGETDRTNDDNAPPTVKSPTPSSTNE